MRRYCRSWDTEMGRGQVWFCGMWESHGWQVVSKRCSYLSMSLLPRVLLETRFSEAPTLDWIAPFTAPP